MLPPDVRHTHINQRHNIYYKSIINIIIIAIVLYIIIIIADFFVATYYSYSGIIISLGTF